MRLVSFALIAALVAAPAQATASLSFTAEEALRTMAHDPDGYCQNSTNVSIPTGNGIAVVTIEDGIARYFDNSELLLEAQRLVAADKDSNEKAGNVNPMAKMMEKALRDSDSNAKLEEERRHRAEVLGQPYSPPHELPSIALAKTKAVRFDQPSSTLFCQSEATVGEALWIAVTWQVGFGRAPSDAYYAVPGHYVRGIQTPAATIEAAIAAPDAAQVAFGDTLRMPLLQARGKVQNDAADLAAHQAAQKVERERAVAYANSPAGKAQEAQRREQSAANMRALSQEYRRLGLACQNHGGTWGVKLDSSLVVPVAPGFVPGELARLTIGCYHL